MREYVKYFLKKDLGFALFLYVLNISVLIKVSRDPDLVDILEVQKCLINYLNMSPSLNSPF